MYMEEHGGECAHLQRFSVASDFTGGNSWSKLYIFLLNTVTGILQYLSHFLSEKRMQSTSNLQLFKYRNVLCKGRYSTTHKVRGNKCSGFQCDCTTTRFDRRTSFSPRIIPHSLLGAYLEIITHVPVLDELHNSQKLLDNSKKG